MVAPRVLSAQQNKGLGNKTQLFCSPSCASNLFKSLLHLWHKRALLIDVQEKEQKRERTTVVIK